MLLLKAPSTIIKGNEKQNDAMPIRLFLNIMSCKKKEH
jgi:hypothetical protein